jgi:ABC-2 type transport system ATP-binding protein
MSIKVAGLTKIFGEQKAVNNISFDVPSGTIVGFLGPNGAGKSTTMKMLTTYIPPTSGTASIYGFDIEKDAIEVRKIVGYLPESNPLYYDLYVKEYLEIVAGIHQIKANKKARIDEVIEMTGLTKEVSKKIGNLSKGYKQRVGLAQAMLHDPKVLILDEPTSGLDPNQLVDIRNLIKTIGKDKTILLSTHIMQEVEAMCERVIIINNGSIVANDAIDAVQQHAHLSDESEIYVTFAQAIDIPTLIKDDISHIETINACTYKIITSQAQNVRKALMQLSLNTQNDIIDITTNKTDLESTFRSLTQQKTQ